MYNDYSDTARYSGGTENNNSYGEYHYSNGSNSDKQDKKDGGKNKFMKSLALCIVLALVFGVVAGAAFQVTGYIGSKVTTSEASSDQARCARTDHQYIHFFSFFSTTMRTPSSPL